MNDHQKIFQLVNDDSSVRFFVKNILDFTHHKKMKEIIKLRETDWSHVQITKRTLSFGDYTYNLNSSLSVEIRVPKYHFGEHKTRLSEMSFVESSENVASDSEEE